MKRLDTTLNNITGHNIRKIAQLFPDCVTEHLNKDGEPELAVDFNRLRMELSNEIIEETEERYQFIWPKKWAAIHQANQTTDMTLRPCREESVDFDHTQNLYIEGDNLDVLKVLRETYLGKVKMIYIDPPYNTGSDFIYNDDFTEMYAKFAESCKIYDEEGNLLFSPAANDIGCGHFHTNWLNMMYPRLKVAKDLLTEDGVIFISIDDHEVDNLKRICNEIFGENNFVANLVWEQGRKSIAAQVAINHEYCLIYAKNKEANIEHDKSKPNTNWKLRKCGLDKIYAELERLKGIYGNNVEKIEQGLSVFYKNLSKSDPAKAHAHYCKYDPCLGIYHPDNISQGTGKGGRFPIIHPRTGLPCKCPSGGWRFSESKLPELLENGRIAFGKDETTVPCLKRFLKETEYEVFASVFYKDGRGASKRLDSLIGKQVFSFPKDEEIIKNFVALTTSYHQSDDIILDFFSGSATTAHAVMRLNAEDGGHRKFIMIQLPEQTQEGSAAHKEGYHTICEIGKERIRRAAKKIKEDNKATDTGFRVLKLATSNIEDVSFAPEALSKDGLRLRAVKEGRNAEDLLFQFMLKIGIEPTAQIKCTQIDGKDVYAVDGNYLMACFAPRIKESTIIQIAQLKPTYFVMLNDAFLTDKDIDNFDQLFKYHSPHTECRII